MIAALSNQSIGCNTLFSADPVVMLRKMLHEQCCVQAVSHNKTIKWWSNEPILDVQKVFNRTKMSENYKTNYSPWVSLQILLKYITVWFDDESTGSQQNVNLKT